MAISDFMESVSGLLTDLGTDLMVTTCTLQGGIVHVEGIVKGPDDDSLTEPSAIRMALHERAEKAIALAEQTWDHDKHPVIAVDGERVWHGDGIALRAQAQLSLYLQAKA